MGRIKTQLAKRTTMELMGEHRAKLKPDFEENKKVVNVVIPDASKKIRNIIAGYATRLVKSENSE